MRFFIGLFLALFFPSVAIGQAGYGEYGGATYVSVIDARTIIVELPEYPALIGEKIKVRINGIHIPKLKGKCKKESQLAIKAKKYVDLVFTDAELIDLDNMKRGIYFQIVADVLVDDEDFTSRLVEKGYAVRVSKKKKSHNWCK